MSCIGLHEHMASCSKGCMAVVLLEHGATCTHHSEMVATHCYAHIDMCAQPCARSHEEADERGRGVQAQVQPGLAQHRRGLERGKVRHRRVRLPTLIFFLASADA